MADTAALSKKDQIASELERRGRIAVPTMAAGVLYLLSGITATAVLRTAPTVSILQGLRPALDGTPNPTVSPRAAEIKFISHHSFGLIASSAMVGIAFAILALALTFVYDAVRHRRPETIAAARPLVLYGGLVLALVSVAHAVTLSVTTHSFAVGHDLSNHAADRALTTGTALVIGEYLDLILTLAFGVGVAMVAFNAQRVGLFPRMLGYIGIGCGVILVLASAGPSLGFIVALWVVAVGFLLMGRWPNGDPPAWASGESRPWPSSADTRAARGGGAGRAGLRRPAAAAAGSAADAPPEPMAPTPSGSGSRRRKRKRGPNQRGR
jgi:hypothetical protein